MEHKLRHTCRLDTPCLILLVEDERSIASLLSSSVAELEPGCFIIEHVTTLADSVAKLQGIKYDAIILDLGLPDSRDISALFALHKLVADTIPIIVLTGVDNPELELSCFDVGAKEFVLKPFDPEAFLRLVRHTILRFRNTTKEIDRLKKELSIIYKLEEELEGEPQQLLHGAMQGVMTVVNRLAKGA